MSQPATIQYDLNFDVKILEPVTLALRDIFQTSRGEVIVMPGSGRTALEAAAISVIEPGDRVLVVVAGVFGSLMREIMTRAGAEVTEHTVEWGRPLDLARLEKDVERVKPKAVSMVHNETSTGTTYPAAEVGRIVKRHGALFMLDTVSSLAGLDVRTDDWGVDFNMTGSQKCLAAPLGMAVVSVSPAAWEAMERRKHKSSSWAYDLLRWKENWIPVSRGGHIPDGSPRRQPVSIPTHLTNALGVASRLILEEGLAHRFRRHAVAGRALPRRPRGDAARDVPGRLAPVQHRVVLQGAGRHRPGRGGEPHARSLRHPDRHRARQDPHHHPAGRAHGHHLEPDVRAAHPVRDRDDAARPRLPQRGRRGGLRGPGASSRARAA